jgi:hypothetical protein
MNVSLERVRSSKGFKTFVSVPACIYADESSYVPPLDREQLSLLHPRRSAFFDHGHAAFWIARKGNRLAGRISAQIDLLGPTIDGRAAGLFGCLDALDDAEVVAALTDAAQDWLRREGARICRGPFMLSINGQSGLLVDGQEQPPMIGMPWHPKYLGGLLERSGYAVVKRLNSYRLFMEKPPARFGEKRGLAEQFTVRPFRIDRFAEEAELCRRLFNDAWKDNWGFVPLAPADMRAFERDLRPFLIQDGAVVVEHKGEPVAFMLILPNLHEAAADLGPSPSLGGWLRFFVRVRQARYSSGRVILLGVASALSTALRGGALLAIFSESIRRVGRRTPLSFEAGWVLDDNLPLLRLLGLFGFSSVRSYHLYERALA